MADTKVLVYGVSNEKQREIAEGFDWETVLSKSKRLIQHNFYPNIYELPGEFAFSAQGKSIRNQAQSTLTSEKAIAVLTAELSAYYGCECYICGD